MGKKIIIFLFTIMLTACTQPEQYVTESSNSNKIINESQVKFPEKRKNIQTDDSRIVRIKPFHDFCLRNPKECY